MSLPRRVLVTGATGFVGPPLLAALRAAHPDAVLVAGVRGSEACPGADASHPFDLLDPGSLRALVAAAAPDACIHLAALSAVAESFGNPDAVWQANVDGSRALAAALLAEAPGCTLLNASSAEVYGLSFQGPAPLDEGAALRPTNPYAVSKAAAELALNGMIPRGLRVIHLRPLNHTGPGQTTRFALPAFARQVARIEAGLQEPVLRAGALDRWRDFLDVRDVCAAYVLALDAAPRLAPGTVFNIASGTLRELAAVVRELLQLAGVQARIETRAEVLRPVDILRTDLSSTAIRQTLDWAPRVPWQETLAGLLDHWRGVARQEAQAGA